MSRRVAGSGGDDAPRRPFEVAAEPMPSLQARLATTAAALSRRLLQRARRALGAASELWAPPSPPNSPAGSPSSRLRSRFASTEDDEASLASGRMRASVLGFLAAVTLVQLLSLAWSGVGGGGRRRGRRFGVRRRSGSGLSRGLAGSLSPVGLTSHYQASDVATSSQAASLAASGLTATDRRLLASVLGFGNFSSFVLVDSFAVQKLAAAAAAYQTASTPCLWSETLQRNVYLIPGGWDQTSGRSSQPNEKHACPLPAGGQVPLSTLEASAALGYWSSAAALNTDDATAGGGAYAYGSGAYNDGDDGDGDGGGSSVDSGRRPAVTFVVAIHLRDGVQPRLAAAVALEAAIALFRHADEVPPSEYLFVDHTSSQPTTAPQPTEGLHPDGSLDLSEVQEFLSFLQHAFGLRIRFIRAAESSALAGSYSSSSGEGSSYLDLTAAALGTARGKLVMLLEADNILQPGCLGALAATLAAHPEAALVVPKALRHGDGRVHDAGGVVLSDGALVRFGRGAASLDESVAHLRDVDFGSWAACLARRRLLVGLGLPDARFRPGYFADVDASFALRRAGWRTLYQPLAHVLHYDGASAAHAATVASSGGGDALRVPLRDLRVAALNQQKLATKWAGPLTCHLPPSLLAAAASKHLVHSPAHRQAAAANADNAAAAENAVLQGLKAHDDRYLRAGSVLRALNLRHGAPTAVGGGGPHAKATAAAAAAATAAASAVATGGLTEGLGWTVEAVAGAARGASLRLLFVDWIAPEVDRDSGSIRARYMLQIFLAARCAVTFVAVDTARPMHYRDDLRFMGVKVLTLRQLRASLLGRPLPAPGSAVSDAEDAPAPSEPGVLPPCPFDVLLLSRRDAFRAAFPILMERCSDAAVVFDTVDLHFLREQREAAYKDHYRRHASSAQPGGYSSSDPLADGTPLNEGDSGGMLDAVFGHRSREGGGASASSAAGALRERLLTRSKAARSQAQDVELQFASFADVTLVVSPFEAKEVAARVPKANIKVVSNIHVLDPTPATFRQRSGAVFTGNFNHLPNRDAVLFFAQDILPLILPQVGPDFVFHVVGSNAVPDAIARLNGTTVDGLVRIVVHGFVLNLKAFYNNMRVSVVPLRWGAGVKGKVNSAMSHGVPVVCTSVAQEGMHLVDGVDALVADHPRAFAAKVLEAYTSERAWRKLREGGFTNVQQHFSISNAVAGLAATLQVVLGRPQSHPDETFSASAATAIEPAAATGAPATTTTIPAMLELLGGSATASSAAPFIAGARTPHQAARRRRLAFGGCAVDATCTCTAELRADFARSAFGLGFEERPTKLTSA